ncbi:MAG: thioredoxin family protein [Chloroflexi bacterium]|nr:thioredoxin family protein [Chloroflexota bacterium]
MVTVKVLGPGCKKNCTHLEDIVNMAVIELGIEAKIEKGVGLQRNYGLQRLGHARIGHQ